jgi:hypothetical protein
MRRFHRLAVACLPHAAVISIAPGSLRRRAGRRVPSAHRAVPAREAPPTCSAGSRRRAAGRARPAGGSRESPGAGGSIGDAAAKASATATRWCSILPRRRSAGGEPKLPRFDQRTHAPRPHCRGAERHHGFGRESVPVVGALIETAPAPGTVSSARTAAPRRAKLEIPSAPK